MSTALLAGLLLGAAACGANGAKTQGTPAAANVSSPTPAVATIDKARRSATRWKPCAN